MITVESSLTSCVSTNTQANAQFTASTEYVSMYVVHQHRHCVLPYRHAYVYCGSHEAQHGVQHAALRRHQHRHCVLPYRHAYVYCGSHEAQHTVQHAVQHAESHVHLNIPFLTLVISASSSRVSVGKTCSSHCAQSNE
jgi:hypothetical protein